MVTVCRKNMVTGIEYVQRTCPMLVYIYKRDRRIPKDVHFKLGKFQSDNFLMTYQTVFKYQNQIFQNFFPLSNCNGRKDKVMLSFFETKA